MPTMANSTAPSPAGVMGKVVKREEAKAINTIIVKGRKKFKEKVTKQRRPASKSQMIRV